MQCGAQHSLLRNAGREVWCAEDLTEQETKETWVIPPPSPVFPVGAFLVHRLALNFWQWP